MKKNFFLLFTIITFPAFSQDAGYRGTIKVKKVVADTGCMASVLGYTGTNIITKTELLKAKKIDLNKICECEIIEYTLSRQFRETFAVWHIGNGDTLNMQKILTGVIKSNYLIRIGDIKAKNKTTGKVIVLPSIKFNIINE